MVKRDYEIAARTPLGFERGGASHVLGVDGRAIIPSIKTQIVDDSKVLQGWACLWNKAAIMSDGRIAIIRPGAFDRSLTIERKVEFWLDHDSQSNLGNVGLELISDEKGLAFRFPFPHTPLGHYARELASTGRYSGMSVGCKFIDYTIEDIDGFKVWTIARADLEEISFVKRGAIEPAFGVLVDPYNSLAEDLSTRVPSDGAYTKLMRALDKLQNALKDR